MDKYEHIAIPAEDGDYETTGTIADYDEWFERVERITLYHLHTAGGRGIGPTTSATRAREFLANGRKLAAGFFPEGSTFGRFVTVATYDNGRPVHVRTYPKGTR